MKSWRNYDYFVFGFVNFENKHENSKSVLLSDNMVILGLQLQTEPKSADDIIGAHFSGLLCVMIWMLCKNY